MFSHPTPGLTVSRQVSHGSPVHPADSISHDEACDPALINKIMWRLIPLIVVCYLFAWYDRINISFAKFHLQRALALSDTAYGVGASLFAIAYVLCEVPSNALLYKIGPRKWLARIMITWGLATAAMIFVHSEVQFYLARFVIGAMEAGFAPGVLYYLATWFPAKDRGRVSSLLFLSMAFSGILGAPLSGFILAKMDGVAGLPSWNWLFLAGGLPCIPLGLTILSRFDDRVEDAAWLTDAEKKVLSTVLKKEAKKVGHHSLREAIKSPSFLLLGLVYFLVQNASYAMNFWMPQLIRTSGVARAEQIGWITALPYLCGGAAMIFAGKISDQTGDRRRVFVGCITTAAIGFLGAAFFATSTVPLVGFLIVLGMGVLSTIPTFWTLPPKVVTGAAAASGIALINSVGQIGGIVSPIMIGRISDLTGSITPALYAMAITCLACAALAYFAFPKSLREKD